jgi:glycosyltransferase involved in cell wall biosynthesis
MERMDPANETRRIRLAYVITGLELGGGGAVVLTLARALDRRRFDLDVYCILEGGAMEEELHQLGYPVHILEWAYDYRRRFLRYSPAKTLRLASMLRQGQYDVVHTHLFQADAIGRVAALLAGVPVIVKSLHNMGRWKTRGHLAVDRVLNRWTDGVICCSDYQRETAAAQERFAEDRALTIHHGVALRRFPARTDRPAAAALGLHPHRLTVGTVGRTIAEKGQEYLLQAMPQILRDHPDTQFLIVGDGNLRPQFEEKLARTSYRDRVFLAGARDDVPEMLSLMDVFVFPSLSEGFGIAVIEAMAARLPVVASAIRPLCEIVVDGVTGLLVPPTNSTRLGQAVSRLLGDPSLRAALGSAGRRRVEERFTDEHMVRATEDLYCRLVRAAHARNGRRQSRLAPNSDGIAVASHNTGELNS